MHQVQVRKPQGLLADHQAVLEQKQTRNSPVWSYVQLGPRQVLGWVLYHWSRTQDCMQTILQTHQLCTQSPCQGFSQQPISLWWSPLDYVESRRAACNHAAPRWYHSNFQVIYRKRLQGKNGQLFNWTPRSSEKSLKTTSHWIMPFVLKQQWMQHKL